MIDAKKLEAMLEVGLQDVFTKAVGNIDGNWNLGRQKVEDEAANAVANLRKTEAVFIKAIRASFSDDPLPNGPPPPSD